MDKYGKILKKKTDSYSLTLCSLNKLDNYRNIMKEQYDSGYTQVIVNTDLMLKIIESMLKKNWVLLRVEIDDPSVDEETLQEITILVDKIKENVLNFNRLKEYLEWALDDGSIFIDKIKISIIEGVQKINCEINSNGLMYGNNNNFVFDNFIKGIIESYLNEA